MPPSILRPTLSCGAKQRPIYAAPAFIIALLCFLAAAGFFAHAQHKLATWERAEGIVVRVESRQSHSRRGNKTKHYAHVRFKAADGRAYTAHQQSGSSTSDFRPGEAVPVLYPADNPADAVIHSPWELYVWCWMAAFGGVVALVSLGLKRLWGKG